MEGVGESILLLYRVIVMSTEILISEYKNELGSYDGVQVIRKKEKEKKVVLNKIPEKFINKILDFFDVKDRDIADIMNNPKNLTENFSKMGFGDITLLSFRVGRLGTSIEEHDYKNELGAYDGIILVGKVMGKYKIVKVPKDYIEKILLVVDDNDREIARMLNMLGV